MKETNTLTNRYGNEYHFTPDGDGNLLWEGPFKLIRVTKTSEDKIVMIDPEGGPFIQEGMDPGNFHPDMNGRKIKGFEPIEGGYKIIMG